MVKWTGKRILRLQLYQEVPKFFGGLLSWEHLPFLVGYAVVLHWVRVCVVARCGSIRPG